MNWVSIGLILSGAVLGSGVTLLIVCIVLGKAVDNIKKFQ